MVSYPAGALGAMSLVVALMARSRQLISEVMTDEKQYALLSPYHVVLVLEHAPQEPRFVAAATGLSDAQRH